MSQSLCLYSHDRLITSPFGLLGTDENALSFALGYTFQQSSHLLQWFLRQIGISGVHHASLRNARIDLQRNRMGDSGRGITDIEIHLPGHFHIVVEAKVGLGVPTIEQCRKYLPRLKATNEPVQKLVALIQSPDPSFVSSYRKQDKELSKRLVGFSWPQLLTECARLMLKTSMSPNSREWVRSFYHFLDQEYGMKAITTEVWILAIDTKPLWKNGLSFWDIHKKYRLYFDFTHPTVRPLYLAFRVEGQVDSIYRVSGIEHSIPVIDLVPELAHVKVPWPKIPHTIWHFGDPVPLANPLRTGSGMYNRRVRCDLDLLLTCKTVQEIESQMKKRRDQPDE